MAVSAVSGTPQYSGTWIPEIWSGNMLIKFYEACVLAAISNTDYQGEISNQGDKVIISQVADITINTYDKNTDMKIQRPEAPNVELVIDKALYFNAICDDIDAHQTHLPLMERWSDDAGERMAITIDTAVLAAVYADAHASNKGAAAGAISGDINFGASGSPVVVTPSDLIEKIIDCKVALGEQNAPRKGRYGVIPEWMSGMVMKSELGDASISGDGTSMRRNGRIGVIANFELYESNLLTSATDGAYTAFHALFGQKHAISFASQMTKMRNVELTTTFARAIQGLNVHGYKVLKSQALIDLYCAKGS